MGDESKMDGTVAQLVAERRGELRDLLFAQVDSALSLREQALHLLDDDTRAFGRFDENLRIPDRDDLPRHFGVDFNSFLVEPLLREGSLLLDRCLEQRQEYRSLANRFFEARIQVDEMIRLSEIAEREDAETYHLPGEIAARDLESYEAIKQQSDDSAEALRIAAERFSVIANSLKDAARRAAYAQAKIEFGDQEVESHGPTRPVHNFVHDHASAAEEFKGEKEAIGLGMQRAEQLHSSISAEAKVRGAKETVHLREKEAAFQRERDEVARFVALRRAVALTASNGELNFYEQMGPVQTRLTNDLIAAWLRLSAVSKGLEEIYDYPPESFPTVSEEGTINLDALVTWCQLTNTWLAAFANQQQQVTRSFSLRQMVGDEAFEDSREAGSWTFRLTATDFSNRTFVRLRGLAAQVDSDEDTGSWNIEMVPPARAIILQGKPEPRQLDQSGVGTIFLGRINERTYSVVPENHAPAKLFNASPIGFPDDRAGEWELVIRKESTSGKDVDDIRDIDLHFTVALV